jgi:NAD(P)-dependent dehydrogenase (short-subunit alcohol dehydrogenase family)
MEIAGRVAVVTGAASGIGLALAERFVAEGMSVVLADVETEALERATARLAADRARVLGVPCDVGDAAQVARLRDRAVEAFGTVHVLCNNAGVAAGRPSVKTKPELWRWIVDVNLLGVAYGIHAFVPLMVAQGEGYVVNTASDAGLAASGLLGPYHATKYAVVGLSESLSLELAGTGVGVSCLCPELVDTKIFESTRNAPAALGLPPPAQIPMAQIEQLMSSKALRPADVAGRVVDAIRANRFWIITHEISMRRLKQRNEDLEAGRNPRPPLEGGTEPRPRVRP